MNGIKQGLSARLLSGTIGVVGLIFFVWVSHLPQLSILFLMPLLWLLYQGLKEYYRLAEAKGFTPFRTMATSLGAAYLVAVYSKLLFPTPLLHVLPALLLLVGGFTTAICAFAKTAGSLGNLAVTVFGFCYLVFPLSCLLEINYFSPPYQQIDSRLWLVFALAVPKSSDIGAYFTGKLFGKHRLAPSISPNKTMEGAVGGLLASTLTSLVWTWTCRESIGTTILLHSVLWGVVLGLLAQLGDLSESILKRDARVQDSSNLPGLGGVLDVLDSLVFTLPFLYLLMKAGVIA